MDLVLPVLIVDDNEPVRESMPDLPKVFGVAPQAFSSAQQFLASVALSRTQGLICRVAIPGMFLTELQEDLNRP